MNAWRKLRLVGNFRTLVILAFGTCLSTFALPVHAANVTVGCPGGSGGAYPSITAALNAIGQTGPSTITVTGTCLENVSLNNARSITIVAGPGGANIVEPTDNDAFDVSLSQDIFLVNLDIRTTGPDAGGVVITDGSEVHINGCNIHDNQSVGVNADTGSRVFLNGTTIQHNNPNDGLDVFDNSKADLRGTTIHNNGDPVLGNAGVFVARNSLIIFHGTNSILNNANVGIVGRNLSNVIFGGGVTTIAGNPTNGIALQEGSHLQINGTPVIQGNGTACPTDPSCGGIFANENSTVTLNAGTIISYNLGSGISAQQGSNVRLLGATVQNNTGDGVHLQWISIGDFLPGNTITGNGGASVFCDERSLALGDLSALTRVRCGEIESLNGHEHSEEDEDRKR